MKHTTVKLVTLDFLSLILAFLFSLFLRHLTIASNYFGLIDYNSTSYTISFIIGSVLLLMVFESFKLYQVRQIELSARIFTVIKALAIWTFITATLMYVIKFEFSRGIFFMTAILATVFICFARFFYFRYRQKKLRERGHDINSSSSNDGDPIEALIIGTGDRAEAIERQIKETLPNVSCRKMDYADPVTRTYLISQDSTDIFIADETLSRDKVLSILVDENLGHHSFRVVLDVFRLATGEIHLNDIDEIPSIASRNEPATAYKLIKRLVDITISTFGLIAVSPLWLLIAVLIKTDSSGPVLIRQTRAGWNSRPFTILKFRTMHVNVPLYEFAPKKDTDERITKVGRLLRRFSLDELPQLWNIFKGDMSLVGPRPEMEFIVKNYAPWQNFRLKAKPGLTGLWQILGRKDIPLHENLEYDFYYVTNRSLLLDSTIILKTIPAVLFGRGAY